MTTDIDESEISGWSDERLERFVAGWLGDGYVDCRKCAATGALGVGRSGPMCRKCDGEGRRVRDYCTDDAAAWRLLQAIPVAADFHEENIYAEFEVGYERTPFFRTKRQLAEIAATCAVRGIEPREVE